MRVVNLSKRVAFLLGVGFLIAGCGNMESYQGYDDSPSWLQRGETSANLMEGQKKIEGEFQVGNYSEAAQIADSLKQNEIYQDKDRLLYALDYGTINFFQGNYEQSVQSFRSAEEFIDQFFSRSAARGIKAFFTNDTELAYNGEVYEDVYLNCFTSLAYLEMDELDNAMVETRKMNQKLESIEEKYSKLTRTHRERAGSMAESDSVAENISWKAGTSEIHDSPFSHFLSAALYAKSGDDDGARIELKNLKAAVDNHQVLPQSQVEFIPAFKQVREPETYNTLLTAFSGKMPEKNEEKMDLDGVNETLGHDIFESAKVDSMKNPGDLEGAEFEIAVPKLEMRPSKVQFVTVSVNDTLTTTLPIIEEMDKVAKETFQAKRDIIVRRAAYSEMIEYLPSTDEAKKVREEDEDNFSGNLREGLGRLSQKMQENEDQADLRGWYTMPGKVYSTVIELPEGNHSVTFEYYSDEGDLLYSENRDIALAKNEQLKPVSSIYTN